MIHFKNKLLMVKTKVAVSSFWSKVIQVRGASPYDTCMSTVLIFTFLFAYLWLFFMREQNLMSDKPARIPSVVLPITSHDNLRVRFLIKQAHPTEVYLFCVILSEVSKKEKFSAKADFAWDSIVPSISVLDCYCNCWVVHCYKRQNPLLSLFLLYNSQRSREKKFLEQLLRLITSQQGSKCFSY